MLGGGHEAPRDRVLFALYDGDGGKGGRFSQFSTLARRPQEFHERWPTVAAYEFWREGVHEGY